MQLLSDLEDAEASVRVSSAEPTGTLRLTCGVSFGMRYLAPALAEFSALHSRLVLDLDLSDRVVDLVEDGFDLAIRIGHVGSQGMVSKRLGWTQIVCCASPAYLERHSEPTSDARRSRASTIASATRTSACRTPGLSKARMAARRG